ncbi:hypothetical protein OAO01_07600 [Oligoflexia bacterium]|nr:hypothetical protein [Oligoflexia bacterium]
MSLIDKILSQVGTLRDSILNTYLAASEAANQAGSADEDVIDNEANLDPTTTTLGKQQTLYFDKQISLHYFGLTNRIWHIALLTLPLDALLLLIRLHHLRQDPLSVTSLSIEPAIALLLAVGVLFSFREQLISLLSKLQSFQKKFQASSKRYPLIIVALIGAAILVVSLAQEDDLNALSVVAIAFGAIVGAASWYTALKQTQAYQSKLATDRGFWIEDTSKYIFFINIIPIVCLRAISFAAAINAVVTGGGLTPFVTCFFASFLLLLCLAPQVSHFLIPCKRCASWTSRAFTNSEYCPRCEELIFKDTTLSLKDQQEQVETMLAGSKQKPGKPNKLIEKPKAFLAKVLSKGN